jgi:hypothetical protein
VENILSIDKNRFFYEWMEPSSQGKALVKQLTAIDIDQGRWEQFDEQDHSESTLLHYISVAAISSLFA